MGRLVDASDPNAVAQTLDSMLERDKKRSAWGRNATRRVYDHFLVLTQVRRWLETLTDDFDRTREEPQAERRASA
jgi:glycosyltransferase involved in cell wall biosynthesis